MAVLDLGEQVEAVAARHREIEHERVVLASVERPQRLVTAGRFADLYRRQLVLEDGAYAASYDGVIVHEGAKRAAEG